MTVAKRKRSAFCPNIFLTGSLALQLAAQLTAFYFKYNPDRLGSVNETVALYHGRVRTLRLFISLSCLVLHGCFTLV